MSDKRHRPSLSGGDKGTGRRFGAQMIGLANSRLAWVNRTDSPGHYEPDEERPATGQVWDDKGFFGKYGIHNRLSFRLQQFERFPSA